MLPSSGSILPPYLLLLFLFLLSSLSFSFLFFFFSYFPSITSHSFGDFFHTPFPFLHFLPLLIFSSLPLISSPPSNCTFSPLFSSLQLFLFSPPLSIFLISSLFHYSSSSLSSLQLLFFSTIPLTAIPDQNFFSKLFLRIRSDLFNFIIFLILKKYCFFQITMTSSPWSSTSWWLNTPQRRKVRTGPRSSPVSASSSRLKVDSEQQKSLCLCVLYIIYYFIFKRYVFSVNTRKNVNNQNYCVLRLPSQTTSTTRQETSAGRRSLAGRCSCCCCAPCWELWCVLWWEPWCSRKDRRGTRGSTERREEEEVVVVVVLLCDELLVRQPIEHIQCEIFVCFLQDCTNVDIFWSTVSGVNYGSVWCWSEGAELVSAVDWFWSTLVHFSLRVFVH